ncbi:MAG: PAS domain S-box protein [Snowella sp.]|nr:PAS domain S-box protein [Snowella sp.]
MLIDPITLSPQELQTAIIRDPLTVSPDTTVVAAITQMSGVRAICETVKNHNGQLDDLHLGARSSCIFVVENGNLKGMLTERDVVRLSAQQLALDRLTIREVMTVSIITLRESAFTDLFVALNLIQQHHIRHLPILDDQDRLVGLVTHESLRHISRPINLLRLRLVTEVMTRQVICAGPEVSMLAIAQRLAEHKVSCVVIIEPLPDASESLSRPLGILTERDLVQFQALGLDLENYQAGMMMSKPLFTVSPGSSLWTVQQLMETRLIRRVPVTGERGELLGIVTQTSLLQILTPLELYKLTEILEEKVVSLEDEKIALLENRTLELEREIEARMADLRAKTEQENLVAQIANRIRMSLNLQEILTACVQEVRHFLQCDRVVVYQFQADGTGVIVAESVEDLFLASLGHHTPQPCLPPERTLSYSREQPTVAANIYQVDYPACHLEMLEQYQVKANLSVPIQVNGQLWGLLISHQCTDYRDWQAAEIALLQNITVQLAIAIQQALAYQEIQVQLKERQFTESRLWESEQRYISLAAAVPVGIFRSDPQGSCSYVNKRWCEIAGISSEAAMGNGWQQIIHPDDRKHVVQQWEQFLQDSDTVKTEFRMQRPDGEITWVYAQVVTEWNANGHIIGYVGTVTDISDRKVAEHQLQQLNQALETKIAERTQELWQVNCLQQAILNSTDYAIISTDLNGLIQSFNQGAERMLGYSAAEVVGKVTPAIFHDEQELRERAASLSLELGRKLTSMLEVFTAKTKQGIFQEQEWTKIRKDGSRFPSSLVISPLKNTDQQVIGFVSMGKDISARKQAEIALKESEELNRQLITEFPVGLASCRLDGQLVYVNPHFAKILGRTVEETLNLSYWDITPIKYQAQEAEQLRQLQETGSYGPYEKEYIHKDGYLVAVSLTGLLIQQKGETLIWSSVQDISDRKQAEQAMRRQTEQKLLLREITLRIRQSLDLQAIFDTACQEIRQFMQADRVGIFKFYPESNFDDGEFVSESLVVGFPSVLAIRVHDHCFGDNYSSLYANGRCFAVADIYNGGLQNCHSNVLAQFQIKANLILPLLCGEQLWGLLCLHQCATPRVWQQEEIDFLQPLANQLAIAIQQANLFEQLQQELTERQQTQQALTERNQQLIRATRLKDEFLANMSHELRTPLNAILGMAEAMQESIFGEITERQKKSLQTIERSGQHLLSLINDILDVAKIESGQLELQCQPTSVPSLCTTSLAFIQQQAFSKQIHVEIQLPQHLPDLLIDERRIRQVLINLLNNAVKFTPEGGRITLEVSQVATPPENAADLPPPSYLQIAVMDTGIGIAPEDIPKLFQPFIQIDSALNRKYEGTGLGLTLVKRLVELHGGQVTVSSEVNVGSCFRIELPCAVSEFKASPSTFRAESTIAANGPNANESRVTGSPVILLAEDNEANLITLSCYLEAKGYQLITAKEGETAIALARSEQPDVIVMDIQMPGMDGLEVIQQMRRSPNLSSIPIIALTALAKNEDRQRCLEAGANEYLSKPVRLKDLAQIIQELLSHEPDISHE